MCSSRLIPNGDERLTDGGRFRLDSAMAEFVKYPRDTPSSWKGTRRGDGDGEFLLSRQRAQLVRDYIVGKFDLDPRLS
jgi:hypothetical protein